MRYKMSVYLKIVVLCVLIIEARLRKAFQLTRGLKDKFTNPQCIDNFHCSVDQCAAYFARCETKSCEVCVCDKQWSTYLASKKRCVKDDEIVPHSVPEYSSFSISPQSGGFFMEANARSNKLDDESHYTGSPNQLWLYTSSRQLLNLKTFQCLDTRNRFGVDLYSCEHKSPNQTWYCNRTSNGLYQMYGKIVSYLKYSGIHFYMGNDKQPITWVPFKLGSWVKDRAICDIPVKYQGCYRFKDGSSVTKISKASISTCKGKRNSECHKEIRISAPIFSAGNSSCKLVWRESSFTINDKPWTPLSTSLSQIHLKGDPGKSREIILQIEAGAEMRWAGALLKLEIQCLERGHSPEQHCVLLKFDGEFNRGTTEKPHKAQSSPIQSTSSPNQSTSNSYKTSTIGLSVALAVLLLVLVVAAVLTYRRRRTRTFTTTKDDDISAKPFCDADEL